MQSYSSWMNKGRFLLSAALVLNLALSPLGIIEAAGVPKLALAFSNPSSDLIFPAQSPSVMSSDSVEPLGGPLFTPERVLADDDDKGGAKDDGKGGGKDDDKGGGGGSSGGGSGGSSGEGSSGGGGGGSGGGGGGGGPSPTADKDKEVKPGETKPGETKPGSDREKGGESQEGRPVDSRPVGKDGGKVGDAGRPGDASVDFPAGAFDSDANVAISIVDDDPDDVAPPSGTEFLPVVIDINVSTLTTTSQLTAAGSFNLRKAA